MEIIEFGGALTTRHGKLLDSKSFLVRPTWSPQLSQFCTVLTVISQSMTDNAPTFPEIVRQLDDWLGGLMKSFIWCS